MAVFTSRIIYAVVGFETKQAWRDKSVYSFDLIATRLFVFAYKFFKKPACKCMRNILPQTIGEVQIVSLCFP